MLIGAVRGEILGNPIKARWGPDFPTARGGVWENFAHGKVQNHSMRPSLNYFGLLLFFKIIV